VAEVLPVAGVRPVADALADDAPVRTRYGPATLVLVAGFTLVVGLLVGGVVGYALGGMGRAPAAPADARADTEPPRRRDRPAGDVLARDGRVDRESPRRQDGPAENKGPVRGHYPAATTKLQGRTAREWGKQALDADTQECYDAVAALNELGAEGTPYILFALYTHQQRYLKDQGGNSNINISHCLAYLDGRWLAEKDIPFVLEFLDDRYGGWGDGPRGFIVRPHVFSILSLAGPRAKIALPRLRQLKDHPVLGKRIADILASIDD
jgi:hypothetical protein